MNDDFLTGGCQCGAVRYRLEGPLREASICHCRMCQKAFGSFFAPLTSLPDEGFILTRGKLSTFRSSDEVERGFCSACGTPLTFKYLTRKTIGIAIGSLDNPEVAPPARQYGLEAKLSYFDSLPRLPGEETEQSDADLADRIRASNHQHPDHDTADWPVR